MKKKSLGIKFLFVLTSLISFTILLFSCQRNVETNINTFAIVVHGGAGGYHLTAEEELLYRQGIEKALNAGYSVLERGGSSLDAVEEAIKVMEESPLFNAGRGSVLNEAGYIEMDASIMEGRELKAGAVAGVKHYLHPISIAKKVMEKSPHVFLVGDGAEKFALSQGFQPLPLDSLVTPKRFQEWQKQKEKRYGTVGAVAIDKNGNIAAGTSTGGMGFKMEGRVGDSPIIGAGTYANNQSCGVSCTGWGEYFIRQAAAFQVSALIHYQKYDLQAAIDKVLQKIKEMGATGGIIGIDKQGNIGWGFSTDGMPRGYKKSDGKAKVLIGKD
jgi:beta-aspartyl-peptidase (threonine type)